MHADERFELLSGPQLLVRHLTLYARVFIHEHALMRRHLFGTRTARLDGQTRYIHKHLLELTCGVASNHIPLTVDHQCRRLKLSSSLSTI